MKQYTVSCTNGTTTKIDADDISHSTDNIAFWVRNGDIQHPVAWFMKHSLVYVLEVDHDNPPAASSRPSRR